MRLARGLPPLARRELLDQHRDFRGARSTSARAERTSASLSTVKGISVYLRSRGENPDLRETDKVYAGLPPLARREPDRLQHIVAARGSTSARAERTSRCGTRRAPIPVYLRSRGENSRGTPMYSMRTGLPPLARRERRLDRDRRAGSRSTSARAERTSSPCTAPRPGWVYLRSRGENGTSTTVCHAILGLPPLARRERTLSRRCSMHARSTSARAERTVWSISMIRACTVYLRSRGENASSPRSASITVGLPPLARREQPPRPYLASGARSTSARAERTSR